MKMFFALIAVCTVFWLLYRSADSERSALVTDELQVEIIDTLELRALLSERQDQIDKARISGKKAEDSNFVLVDVRSDREVQVSIIPGAITKAEYDKDATEHRGKLVIAYCTVGVRSGEYAEQLVANQIQAKNYLGSILDWVGAGLPLATLDGKSTNRVHTYSDRYQVPATYEQVTE